MPEPILFHYDYSPFSEKIRLMLGYTGLNWRSIKVREMPPRPHLAMLAGGYRKIPVLQIGSDIFCDTRTISTEIASLSGKPELAVEFCDEPIQAFVEKVDGELFLACIMAANGASLMKKLIKTFGMGDVGRFLWDRINMGRKARVKSITTKAARQQVLAHLKDLEQRLDSQFLFGERPIIADFSAYHGLWFIRDIAELDMIDAFPKVSAWMDRLKQLGHGRHSQTDTNESLSQIAANKPREVSSLSTKKPEFVTIAPDDYGRDPAEGLLVSDEENTWIIARKLPSDHTVHVHFPQKGYSIRESDQQ